MIQYIQIIDFSFERIAATRARLFDLPGLRLTGGHRACCGQPVIVNRPIEIAQP